LQNTIAAFFTLCIFSFLYKDNPFYKLAESVVVGIAAGYFLMLLYHTGFFPKFINPIKQGKYWYIIPGILGIAMYFRFSKKFAWISRYPLAFYIGSASGIAIPLTLQTFVFRQLESTIIPVGFTKLELLFNLLVVIMVLCALIYFFFSLEHKGAVGAAANLGIWVIMIGFGASFGYTVMARISLLIGRIQFLMGTWLGFF
jgi:hypothetical protein